MSADPLDQAQELTEMLTQNSITSIRAKKRELNPIGECVWCSEPFNNPKQLFCDEDCREDFEKYNKHR